MKNMSFFMILMTFVTLFVGGQAGASSQRIDSESINIAASKDNTLYEDSAGSLSNGSGEFFFSGRTSQETSAIRRGLIAFESLGIIPAGSLILRAELTLHMSKTNVGPYPIALHRVQAEWGEGASNAPGNEGGGAPAELQDATWLHTFFADQFWQAPGGDFMAAPSATTIVGSIGSYTWSGPDIVDDVYGWMIDPSSNYGWVMLNESSSITAKRFDSRENSTAGFQPKLVVTYLPPDQLQRIYLPIIAKN